MKRHQIQDLLEQAAIKNVTDEKVLHALQAIDRKQFVPEEEQACAYMDFPLPIGRGQTISQPTLVAKMTQLLEVEPRHRVLEVGTGSGYQTAFLAELAGSVYTIEVRASLSIAAQKTLSRLKYRNIFFRIGDGTLGWAEQAPFDRILVTASGKEVPARLVEQLKEGGRLLIPIETGSEDSQLILVTKSKAGTHQKALFPVRFVPIVHE
ncbi:MAG: protein-L-isoaspartate(D-aspartate) O-methyltransferase, partial [Pseudobdellovibrionaceae bacterium]